ncbi:MAG TPA: erythromycin esterase family protein [Caulobacterales bacterium]|nr:erythromycin esterase family protein [Caulobacterales bacterium]
MTISLKTSESHLADVVRASAETLPELDQHEAFAAHFDRFADARVVLLGEATHGTAEFYRARAAITRRLIEKHGFRILAIEGDWPDAAELDRYVRAHGKWGERSAFVNFPRWMWRNREFADLLRGLRKWNEARAHVERVEVRGLDVYSLHRSVDEVLSYLDRVDPEGAKAARRRYGCITPYLERPQAYGAMALRTGRTCEDAVVEQLVAMLEQQLKYTRADGEAYFDAEQNARVVAAAEQYYRAMYHGSAESWNLRDGHMFDTLTRLLELRGPDAKAVVWAHNSHIGNAAATSMGEGGELNIGQLARVKFRDAAVSIGFSTNTGAVMAADDWGDPPRIKKVLPVRADSWERVFLDAGMPRTLTTWRGDARLADELSVRRLERAIGVIYRPETERWSHYFDAHLSRQFDALVWFADTTAVTPLAGAPPEGAPDIYPFGV